MKFKSKKRKFQSKNFSVAPRRHKKINEDLSNVSLKKGKLLTVMISNFPKNQSQHTLDSFLKSKGILCWGCRANYLAQVAFVDVEVKDCERILALNEQEWDGYDLAVKIDETTGVRKKKTKNEKVTKFETVERHRRTLCCKNVPFDVFSQKIESLFKGVKEVYIVRDQRTGRPTGIAFIEFFDENDLEVAFEKKDVVRINGRKLELIRCEEDTREKEENKLFAKYLPNTSRAEGGPQTTQSFFDRIKQKKGIKTVVMSNFPEHENQSSIIKFLKGHGVPVTECRVNFETRIAFLDVQSKYAQKALRLNSTDWNDFELSVVEEETTSTNQISKSPRGESNPHEKNFETEVGDERAERTLCCRNLPFGIFAQRLELLFKEVKEVRNLHDSSGLPTGMAYIEFYSVEALEAAYAKKDLTLDGRKLQLSKMGALVKTSKSTLKRTVDKTEKANESNKTSLSPETKRKKKAFKKSKKGVVGANKFMRR